MKGKRRRKGYYYYTLEVCYKRGIKKKIKQCWTAQTEKTQTEPKRKNTSNYILSLFPLNNNHLGIISLNSTICTLFSLTTLICAMVRIRVLRNQIPTFILFFNCGKICS